MSIQFDIAKQIIAETCPNRKLKLENIRLFADIIQPKKYQKGDIILNEGDICNCLFYIEKGFIRQHCIDSYFNREPTHLMMDAVENSVLWEIPRDIMEELSDANGDIAYLYRSFFENSLMLSQLKADILRFESANDRYARLQQHFPEITRRAPLTMIASYLQMTLETLSRVRVSIANAESK
ncbi:MAG: Crp/Fnr family transcriptional regulator [Bacteroides sp.]|nr:Crp/Fnr family transcriptional regulator [Bacteroides sp.]